jgi:hypothetical protein
MIKITKKSWDFRQLRKYYFKNIMYVDNYVNITLKI